MPLPDSFEAPRTRCAGGFFAVSNFGSMDSNARLPQLVVSDYWRVGRDGRGTSYNLYQAKMQPDGLQINVGPNGLNIQGK